MSSGIACNCGEKRKPVKQRAWIVFARKHNHSAFNGYHYTPSDYSAVRCLNCHAHWRTKAAYVEDLEDGTII